MEPRTYTRTITETVEGVLLTEGNLVEFAQHIVSSERVQSVALKKVFSDIQVEVIMDRPFASETFKPGNFVKFNSEGRPMRAYGKTATTEWA